MVEAHRVVLKYAARGARRVQRADRKVRDAVSETARMAKRKTGEIQQWFKANREALLGIGLAMTGVMTAIIRNSPTLSAHMDMIRLSFSLIAMEIGQELAPAFQQVSDFTLGVADAFAELPGPIKSAISWTIALTTVLFGGAGLLAALQAVWTFIAGSFVGTIAGALVSALSTAWGWITTLTGSITVSTAALFALAGAIGAAIGIFAVWILEITGVLDKIRTLGDWVGDKLPNWVRDLATVILSVGVGALAVLGAAIVGLVQDGFGGMKREINNVIDLFSGAWSRTLDRAVALVQSFVDTAVAKFGNLGQAVLQALQNIGTVIVNAFNDAVDSIQNLNFYSIGYSLINQLENGIRGAADLVRQAALSIAQTIASPITNAVQSAWRWGEDLVTFLANGISSAADTVKEKAKDTINWIRNSLGFDEARNDRMAQRWGRDMLEYFARGMQQAQPTIQMQAAEALPVEPLTQPPAAPPSTPPAGDTSISITVERGAIQAPRGTDPSGIDINELAEEVSASVKRNLGARST